MGKQAEEQGKQYGKHLVVDPKEVMAQAKLRAKDMPKETRKEFLKGIQDVLDRRAAIKGIQVRQNALTKDLEAVLVKHGVQSFMFIYKMKLADKEQQVATGWNAIDKTTGRDGLELPTILMACLKKLLNKVVSI